MKAKILTDGGKVFYEKKRKQPRTSLSLDDCLDRIFIETDPVKLNVRRISELRNNAMHLIIPFVPPDIMGLFQAGVINYPRSLQDWFGINISDRVPLGMMALIYDFDPKMHSLEYLKMKRKLPAETARWLAGFQQDIRNQAETLGDRAAQFYISVDLKLAIIKNPSKADIILSSGIAGQALAQEALIVEVAKNIDKTHPYRGNDVVRLVNERLGRTAISIYDVVCIRGVYDIEHKAEFYSKSKYSARQHSQNFVDWIVSQATKDSDFFTQTRQEAKAKQYVR